MGLEQIYRIRKIDLNRIEEEGRLPMRTLKLCGFSSPVAVTRFL